MRVSLLTLAAFAATSFVSGVASAQTAKPKAAPAASPEPKLVLTIVVDQFRYDYLERFRSDYKAGLKTLLERGAVMTQAYYDHFPTVTAVGHSVVMSGAFPSASGIVGNEWYDRETGKEVTSVSDDDTKLLGGGSGRGSSPHRFLVSTVGDELKMSGRDDVKVIGVSLKDRAAILPSGHMANGAFWFDSGTGNFVSSTYYFAQLPDWASKFNSSRTIDQYAGKPWKATWDGTVFSTLPSGTDKKYWTAVTASSYGNDLLESFAEAAIDGEKLGQRKATDVLTVSFSSNDIVGHRVGPDSPMVREMAISADRSIGKLLAYVDAKVGLANVLISFTADHGVAPLPELMKERKMPGGRVPEKAVETLMQKALVEHFGEGKWIVGHSGPAPYFDHALIASKKLTLAQVQAVAAEALRAQPYIARVYTSEEVRAGLPASDAVARRVQNGYFESRVSDLFIVSEPYWLFEEHGTSHGTPWNYDAHVPLIMMGKSIRAGRYATRAAVNDIAPTLSTVLHVETPSGSAGRVLDEILLNSAR